MRRFLKDNGLTLVLLAFFAFSLVGQGIAGWKSANQQHALHSEAAESLFDFLSSGDFAEAVFENWESEFLQMAAYVFFTSFLVQRGSAESKDPDEDEDDVGPITPQSPAPVRKGGWALKIYGTSLGAALFALFAVSFFLHASAGARAYNEEQTRHGHESRLSTVDYLGNAQFWFESFENWQSEFLSVAAMVVLSIYLRQKGSPESKPLAAPHAQTGA